MNEGLISMDGPKGILRGFMMAGVPTVVGTLWRADDIYSKDFTPKFYKHLLTKSIYCTFILCLFIIYINFRTKPLLLH